jgi:hypothetical protein
MPRAPPAPNAIPMDLESTLDFKLVILEILLFIIIRKPQITEGGLQVAINVNHK